MKGHNALISMGHRIDKITPGSHICYIYNDENERRQVVREFLEKGLIAGELVVYVANKATPEEVLRYLEEIGIDLSKVSRDDQLLTVSADSAYCPDGHFSPERTINNFRTIGENGIAQGFTNTRFMGEMDWALNGCPGSERLIEYEAIINSVCKEIRSSGICQYDARRFDGATLFEVLRVHPMMVVRGQVVENPYYLLPEEFLKERVGN